MTDIDIVKIQQQGEIPAPRFGHTFTPISKTKAILFGGAIGDSGKFIITNDTYVYDFISKIWKKVDTSGQQCPSQRAAHASCMIEQNQMIVYGGAASGGGGLSSDDLWHLDMRQGMENWKIIQVKGQTPGKRYGHTMVFFKPFLIVFGGNTGTVPVNDVWILNIEKAPFIWSKFNPENEQPCVRVYHSANLCQTGQANGMMVVFGGRTSDQSALNDCWGLRKHRDGRWDWVQAPYKSNSEQPICRYQHWIGFVGSLMMVVGGRTNATDEASHMIEMYDTESSDWYRINAINRYRHSIVQMDQSTLFMHGGFEPEYPNKPLDTMLQLDVSKVGQIFPKLQRLFTSGGAVGTSQQSVLQESSNYPNMKRQVGSQQQPQQQAPHQMTLQSQSFTQQPLTMSTQVKNSGGSQNLRPITPVKTSTSKGSSYSYQQTNQPQKNIRLSNQAVVATTYDDPADNENMNPSSFAQGVPIKRVPLQKLAEESKKLGQGYQQDMSVISQQNTFDSLCQIFLSNLLRPKEWKQNEAKIPFKRELIMRLVEECLRVVENQPSLLRLRVPIKIFGSIYGRFSELLRFFENFGCPTDDEQWGGDIERFDYLFLGNYVNRGFNSLETICALFALKVRYPDQIHLLRGKHDDRRMNKIYGFAEECQIRLGEDITDPNSIYQRVNRVFDSLPLAALIENRILCLHGGIGNIRSLEQLDEIQRPCNIWDNQDPTPFDALWSEYQYSEQSVSTNRTKDLFNTGKVKTFGENKLNQFLNDNRLTMLIRGNDCVQEGFDKNPNSTLVNVFSVSDYGAKFNNLSAMIKIKKNFEIAPHILNPLVTSLKPTWLHPDSNLKSGVAFDEQEQQLKSKTYTPPRKSLRN